MTNAILKSICCVLLFLLTTPALAQEISFNRQVRPILADICFNCHGPDAAATEGSLRLDEFERAILAGDSGEHAIVPGDSQASELMRRIRDSDDPMPPAEFEKQLTAKQIETLGSWIDQGAKFEGHWAFTSPVRPAIPKTTRKAWAKNPVDDFILASLEKNGLQPAPSAKKTTLIRRVSLDLTGLPPTVKEVDAFLDDDSPGAYERVVDRLMSSVHYGERMAIPWLDYARYADSNGFQSDGSRDIWAWRDWVINAYNRNLSFDQFTIQQLAGDMLPNPSRAQIIATGFNRNHRLNGEGGRIVDEWFVETVIDRVETTGLTWLGLTFNCCRCHDHKYDPISQKEFYQVFAFFNSVEESGVLAPTGKNGENTPPLFNLSTPETDAKVKQLNRVVSDAKIELEKLTDREHELVAEWASQIDLDSHVEKEVWSIAEPISLTAEQGIKFEKQPDSSYLATGKNPANATYEIKLPLTSKKFTGLMIEAFPDPSLASDSLGRSPNGNFVLSELKVTISNLKNESASHVHFKHATADYEQSAWTADSVLHPADGDEDDRSNSGWGTLGFKSDDGTPNRIMFVVESPVSIENDTVATIQMIHRSPYAKHAIGRFRLQVTDVDPEHVTLGPNAIPSEIREIVSIAATKHTESQTKRLISYFQTSVPNQINDAKKSVVAAEATLKDYQDRMPTTMVMKEGEKRDAFILNRGEYDQSGEKVERKLPAFLPSMKSGQPMNRLGFANWIVDPSNPLTARVWVNRQWEILFGVGIVKTSENFGTQSDFPQHPELLDWLAVEFMEGKNLPDVDGNPAQRWDMKALVKLLVMSSTYQQNSVVNEEILARDPENRLLSRGPRFRLTGELIRDQALAVSGLLKTKIGGPSVRPYMPEGVWDETSVYGNLRNYKHDAGDGRYRRTMYTIWKRTAAPPSMLLFDAPNREVCTVKRSKTNTPLQALSLLNEITFVEAAQSFATRMKVEGGDSIEEQIAFGFKAITARQANDSELAILMEGFNDDLARFSAKPNEAAAFLKSVNENQINSFEPSEYPVAAARALTANVLLNLDEFVTRE